MNSTTSRSSFNLRNIAHQSWMALQAVLARFPLTILASAGLASLLIYRIAVPYSDYQSYAETLDRLTGISFLAIFLSLCVSLILEKKPYLLIHKVVALVLQGAVLVAYYIILLPEFSMVTSVRLGLTIIALLLSFIFIPYFFRRKNLENYIIKLIEEFATTIFFSLVLAAGVSMILFAIESLLIDNLSENLYAYTWILTATLFAPIHFLSSLPKPKEDMDPKHYNQVIRVVLTYIVLPLLSVYTAVLYIYFAKIIITWDWPSGIVSYLVSSYAAVGIVSMYLLWPFRETNRWVKTFISVFTKIIFPLLIMMFIAIGIRISAYGFTERRYFVLIIGLWATAVMIFINFNKGKNNIVFIMSLALACLIAVYGPLSAFDVSMSSQNGRFNTILENNGLLVNGQLQAPTANYSQEDRLALTSILNYFYNNHEFADLKILPSDFGWDQMEAVLGLTDRYPDRPYEMNSFDYYRNLGTLDINGYDLLFEFNHYDYGNADFTSSTIEYAGQAYHLEVSNDSIMHLFQGEEEVCVVDLTLHFQSFFDQYGVNAYPIAKGEPHPYDLTVKVDFPTVELYFIYGNINGQLENDVITYTNAHGYLLVKLK